MKGYNNIKYRTEDYKLVNSYVQCKGVYKVFACAVRVDLRPPTQADFGEDLEDDLCVFHWYS